MALARARAGWLLRCRLAFEPTLSRATVMTEPRTIVDKIWTEHVVTQDPGAPAVLAIDLHLVHEVNSPQAFTGLRARGLKVRRPSQTVATADHSVPTTPRDLPFLDEMAAAQVSVVRALRHSGGLNAGTPSDTASTPVSATAP